MESASCALTSQGSHAPGKLAASLKVLEVWLQGHWENDAFWYIGEFIMYLRVLIFYLYETSILAEVHLERMPKIGCWETFGECRSICK
jgi:hypothetical protein